MPPRCLLSGGPIARHGRYYAADYRAAEDHQDKPPLSAIGQARADAHMLRGVGMGTLRHNATVQHTWLWVATMLAVTTYRPLNPHRGSSFSEAVT
jgi:hypothetical protein